MKRALWLSSGVILWAVHFVAIYGYTGLACARAMERSVPWAVGGMTVAGAGIAAALLARAFPRRSNFEAGIAAGLVGFALLAMLWEGASLLMVPACAGR